MALSHELISQFAKIVKDDKKQSSESTVYGMVVTDGNGNKYVKLDGSDQLTPLTDSERPSADSTTASANEGERVSVLIKNHTATVTGNISSPSVRSEDFKNLDDQVTDIKKFDIVIAERVQANEGYIKKLQTDKADVGDLTAANAKITELETKKASVEELNAAKAEITDLKTTKLDTEVANATYATIKNLDATNANLENLDATYGQFQELATNKFTAIDADIKKLDTEKLSATTADAKYATIDFSNIGMAAIQKLFTDSGIIGDLVVSEGHITGKLVGVTIIGDLIEGGTVKADKLVVLGEDGLYYKLNTNGVTTTAEQTEYNSLNGSVITAKSITAEKVKVDDLVAFDATIGGFNITNSSIYSGAKESVTNTTRGIYLDKNGQISFGDADNYIRYYKASDGTYKLEISADTISIKSGSVSTNLNDALDDINNKISNSEVAIEQNRSAIEIRATKNEVLDAVAKASNDLENTISDEYVNKSNYATDKDTTSKRIDGVEEHAENNTKAISDSTKSADEKISNLSKTLSKYFKFDTNGLTIGSGENSLKLVLDNNEIGFFKNNQKIAWWDGNYLHTGNIEVATNERAQFGNFAFIPRSDGSLMFLKVSDTEVSG